MAPLLTDLLCSNVHSDVLETRLEDLIKFSSSNDMLVHVWLFASLEIGESLHEAVLRHMEGTEGMPGPHDVGSLKYVSEKIMKAINFQDLETAAASTAADWGNIAAFKQMWQAHLKSLATGNTEPSLHRGVMFGELGGRDSQAVNVILWPAIIQDMSGIRHWGLIDQIWMTDASFTQSWALRDLLVLKYAASCLTVVAQDTGMVLWQNTASMAMFGCHGLFSSHMKTISSNQAESVIDEREWGLVSSDSGPSASEPLAHDASCPIAGNGMQINLRKENFLELLFGQDMMQQLQAAGRQGDTFKKRVEITHPILRKCMGLKAGDNAFHKAHATLSRDPITLQRVFIISQVDITETVSAKQQLQKAHAILAEEKKRMDALVKRQYDLIACLGMVTDVGTSPGNNSAAAELIAGVQRQLAGSLSMEDDGGLEVMEMIGEGSYGKVFKGRWKGREVAVKSVTLPSNMSGKERHRQMAVMEAAISSSLSHPNILQTHTYNLKAFGAVTGGMYSQEDNSVLEETSGLVNSGSGSGGVVGGGSGSSHRVPSRLSNAIASAGFEVQLVMEYCDCGSLREALDSGFFLAPLNPDSHSGADEAALGDDLVASDEQQKKDPGVNYEAVLSVMLDVARGMAHLHSMNVIHSDLKAGNVLLQGAVNTPVGVVAKVSDFGLSFKMDQAETHVSSMFQGTQTHMAPEVMESGCLSKAADVYAFAITMWEAYTSHRAFHGVNKAYLGYQVSRAGLRPEWPAGTPTAYADLANRCWSGKSDDRPSFREIVAQLADLQSELLQSPALNNWKELLQISALVQTGVSPLLESSDASLSL
ncbi:hypothetical protein CEUSTIGMA_g987.t1 [Chlamydomonas eustigma]|uniref:Protein kinase domain-containing protein n=1 Tax=Chlamydomonas eustigma TaxID=1157962 RepID=A0A250WS51_9CHLO|nr:hypothetical protein CEUSTIGMA_g987.t1 [Chlamydomonas eustigma]|eukprot:GAX73536.1 hypothetical protein CEUSTIGMA_g987.t1 [Chlamydomonas eustigma]